MGQVVTATARTAVWHRRVCFPARIGSHVVPRADVAWVRTKAMMARVWALVWARSEATININYVVDHMESILLGHVGNEKLRDVPPTTGDRFTSQEYGTNSPLE